jgi:uncharacterized protein YoxC
MTNEISRIQYTADNIQTEFAYPFRLFDAHNLRVYVDNTLVTTGWRINKISEAGMVVFDVAPASGCTITLERVLPLTRISDFQDAGLIKAKTLNDEFDYRVGVEAQINDKLSRALTYPANTNFDNTVPYPVAKKALIWNEDGTGIINSASNIDELAVYVETQISEIEIAQNTTSEQLANTNSLVDELNTKVAEVEDLRTSITGKAEDNSVVHLSGDEIINGTKTFSTPIVGSINGNATSANNAATANTLANSRTIALSGMASGTATSFDGSSDITIPITSIQSASDIQAGVVDTQAQTFSGIKTFASSPVVPTPNGLTDAANKNYVDSVSSGNYVGASSTASAVADKVATCSNFVLSTGVRIRIKFDNANTVAGALTLNVESTGAKGIRNEAGVAVSANSPAYFPAGAYIEFWYDGTYWAYVNRVVDEYVNGTSGYEILANGKIKQWGQGNCTVALSTINLLKTMRNTDYIAYGNQFVSTTNSYAITFANPTTTTLQWKNNAATLNGVWVVEGY